MSNRCEDYPCCGHTDGLPCDWTPNYSDPHFLCDHESGECEVQNMLDEIEDDKDECADPDCDEDVRDCGHREFGNPFEDDYGYHGSALDEMEDQWLDGSYED